MSINDHIDKLWELIDKQFHLAIKNEELTEEISGYKELFLKFAEKRAIFKKLVVVIEAYVDSNGDSYVATLSNLAIITNKLRMSLYKIEKISNSQKFNGSSDGVLYRNDSWFALQPIVKAMSIKGSGRLKSLEQAFILKTYQNRQLLPFIVEACGDSYTKISTLALYDMLPFFGEAGLWALNQSLSFEGGKSELNKLKYLLKNLKGNQYRSLVKAIFTKGSIEFKKEALKECDAEPWMKDYLIELKVSRSSELAQLAQCVFEKLPG